MIRLQLIRCDGRVLFMISLTAMSCMEVLILALDLGSTGLGVRQLSSATKWTELFFKVPPSTTISSHYKKKGMQPID